LNVNRAVIEGVVCAKFDELVLQRHSVRTFTGERISDEVVIDCVGLAQRSPSACNRQSVRVHVYSNKHDIQAILRHQDGNYGFGDTADRLILLAHDNRAVLSSSERNQPYLDAGLFAMTLIYALESRNVASCCLNLSNYWFRDLALRRACRTLPWERPVLLIAIGRSPQSYQVPVSARPPTESILRFHHTPMQDSQHPAE
jgi:nitroreductase